MDIHKKCNNSCMRVGYACLEAGISFVRNSNASTGIYRKHLFANFKHGSLNGEFHGKITNTVIPAFGLVTMITGFIQIKLCIYLSISS